MQNLKYVLTIYIKKFFFFFFTVFPCLHENFWNMYTHSWVSTWGLFQKGG